MLTFRFTLASISFLLSVLSFFLVSMESAIESVYVGDPFTWTGATPTIPHTHTEEISVSEVALKACGLHIVDDDAAPVPDDDSDPDAPACWL